MREVVGLFARAAAQRERLPVGRGGAACAALVEEEHPVVLERPVEPGLLAGEPVGAESGAALEVEEPRQVRVFLADGHRLAGEQLDALALGVVVVERHGEAAVGEDDTGLAVCGGRQGSS